MWWNYYKQVLLKSSEFVVLTCAYRISCSLIHFSALQNSIDFPPQAAEEMRSVDESIGSGKLYFTGTGYTVNLIPHAIVLGLLALGEHLLLRVKPLHRPRQSAHWCKKWNWTQDFRLRVNLVSRSSISVEISQIKATMLLLSKDWGKPQWDIVMWIRRRC